MFTNVAEQYVLELKNKIAKLEKEKEGLNELSLYYKNQWFESELENFKRENKYIFEKTLEEIKENNQTFLETSYVAEFETLIQTFSFETVELKIYEICFGNEENEESEESEKQE